MFPDFMRIIHYHVLSKITESITLYSTVKSKYTWIMKIKMIKIKHFRVHAR